MPPAALGDLHDVVNHARLACARDLPLAGDRHRHDARANPYSRVRHRRDRLHAHRCRYPRTVRDVRYPPAARSIFFGLFVFTIGYRSGPEFFASLSLHTLSQVVLALVMGACGLIVILDLCPHVASRCRHGCRRGRRQPDADIDDGNRLRRVGAARTARRRAQREQANIAAGYAVTYICGYILVLLFVPLVAPRLMGVNLKEEAAKLEAALSGGAAPPKAGNLLYRKFQARAYQVSAAAGAVGRRDRGSNRTTRGRRAHPAGGKTSR